MESLQALPKFCSQCGQWFQPWLIHDNGLCIVCKAIARDEEDV